MKINLVRTKVKGNFAFVEYDEDNFGDINEFVATSKLYAVLNRQIDPAHDVVLILPFQMTEILIHRRMNRKIKKINSTYIYVSPNSSRRTQN